LKLYKYGKCLICLGTSRTWYNRPCPYCDKGTALHEVSTNSLKTHILQSFSEAEKQKLFNLLKQELEEKQNEKI